MIYIYNFLDTFSWEGPQNSKYINNDSMKQQTGTFYITLYLIVRRITKHADRSALDPNHDEDQWCNVVVGRRRRRSNFENYVHGGGGVAEPFWILKVNVRFNTIQKVDQFRGFTNAQ